MLSETPKRAGRNSARPRHAAQPFDRSRSWARPSARSYPDIDGFLVGGASLKPEICEIAKEIAVAKNTFAMGGA